MWIFADIVPLLGAIAAGLAVLSGFVKYVLRPAERGWRWFKKRKRLNAALQRLACGVQLQMFTDVLGRPPTHRTAEGSGEQALVVTDGHGNVQRFDITLRSPKFAPTLRMHEVDVILGRTTYAELPDAMVTGIEAWYGARKHFYAEAYYFGNPGYYQHWVVASNPAGPPGIGPIGDLIEALGGKAGAFIVGSLSDGGHWLPDELPDDWKCRPGVARFRESTRINTLSVSGPHRAPGSTPGPDVDHVRILASR
jgi:hypothetical protein